jgi:dsRNA-specific ribonuclease
MLQEELDEVAKEYKAPDLVILSAFDARNLGAFAEAAAAAERAIIAAIEADGTKLDIYATVEEFLEKNP